MAQALLVTGAAGQPGRRVIDYPLQGDTLPIIATTRHSSKLAEPAAKGVGVRAADFDKPETLSSAFAGVDRALYVPGQRVAEPGRHRLPKHRPALRQGTQRATAFWRTIR